MGGSNGTRVPRKRKLSGRILLVDDHEALASIRRTFLVQEGYEVVCACDGQQVRRLLATDTFHLVITDSALPDLSGWEVASDAKKQGVPVILSSGWPVRMSPSQLTARGVDFLCPKPCRLRQLLWFVKKPLSKRKPRGSCETLVPKAQYQSPR